MLTHALVSFVETFLNGGLRGKIEMYIMDICICISYIYIEHLPSNYTIRKLKNFQSLSQDANICLN